jgi:hypothetical protein
MAVAVVMAISLNRAAMLPDIACLRQARTMPRRAVLEYSKWKYLLTTATHKLEAVS